MNKSEIKGVLFSTISGGALALGFATGGVAHAQGGADSVATVGGAASDIVVTARRKEENLLETPVAINAMTGDELAARNIVNLQDLAQNVPGANVVNQASNGGRSDRSFQAVVLRGIAPSTGNLQTVSVFIDGVPVSSSIALQTITSPERIEVLKGPQSAYFGRQTFAGAINVVNQMPTADFSGSVSGLVGTRGNYDATVELSGPLAGEKLGFRVVGRANGKHGSYQNYADPYTTLGDQSTKTGSLLLVAKPAEGFTAKLFGLVVENIDGAPAQGLISAYEVRDDSGAIAAVNQSNCTVNGNPFFCGTAPKLSPYTPAQTTALSPTLLASLRNPANRLVSPADGPQGLGLTSRTYHAHLAMDWEIGDSGFTVSSLTGYNKTWYSEIADSDNIGATNFATYTANGGGGFNTLVYIDSQQRDYSQELLVTFDNGGPLHATFGASYLDTKSQGAFGPNGSRVNGALTITKFGVSGARTIGGFFGLGYDLSSKLTVNFDGRYQVDRVASYAGPSGSNVTNDNLGVPLGFYAPGKKVVEVAYKNFTPRVIVQYKPNDGNMMYASYSKGVNPGIFNTTLLTQRQQALDIARANNIGVIVNPEKLDNYEIGFKGKLFDRRVTYEVAAFHALWTNQINQQSFVYTDANNARQSFVVSTNTGRTNIKGVEVDLGFVLAPGLTLDLSGAYIDSIISRAANGPITVLTGRTNFGGNRAPLVSKWAGAASAQYLVPLVARKNIDLMTRVDFTYKSGAYSDIANLVKGPDVTNVNLTLGIQTEKFGLHGFVTNVFNNDAYYSVITQALNAPTAPPAQAALIAQLRDLRTFGLKGSVKF